MRIPFRRRKAIAGYLVEASVKLRIEEHFEEQELPEIFTYLDGFSSDEQRRLTTRLIELRSRNPKKSARDLVGSLRAAGIRPGATSKLSRAGQTR